MTGGSHSSKVGVVLGIIAGVMGLCFVVFILFYCCKGRRKGYRPEVFIDVTGKQYVILSFPQQLIFFFVFKVFICFVGRTVHSLIEPRFALVTSQLTRR